MTCICLCCLLFVICMAFVCETFETPPDNKKLLSVACRMKYKYTFVSFSDLYDIVFAFIENENHLYINL